MDRVTKTPSSINISLLSSSFKLLTFVTAEVLTLLRIDSLRVYILGYPGFESGFEFPFIFLSY